MLAEFNVPLLACYCTSKRQLNPTRVAELAKQLDLHILEAHDPILVTPRTDDDWNVLDGKYRVAAALLAGWEVIPARVWRG